MKTFEYELDCPESSVPRRIIVETATLAARAIGMLKPGEALPDGTGFEIHKDGIEVNGVWPIKIVVEMPESSDDIPRLERLLDDIDLGPQ